MSKTSVRYELTYAVILSTCDQYQEEPNETLSLLEPISIASYVDCICSSWTELLNDTYTLAKNALTKPSTQLFLWCPDCQTTLWFKQTLNTEVKLTKASRQSTAFGLHGFNDCTLTKITEDCQHFRWNSKEARRQWQVRGCLGEMHAVKLIVSVAILDGETLSKIFDMVVCPRSVHEYICMYSPQLLNISG